MTTHVVFAVRCGWERQGWWHPHLGTWIAALPWVDGYTPHVETILGVDTHAGASNDAALRLLTKYPEAEWLCILDNDVGPTANLLRMLDDVPDDADAISPICNMVMYGVGSFPQQGYRDPNNDGGFIPIDPDEEPKKAKEVDRIGGGCWFIRRRVFSMLMEPYFVTQYDALTRRVSMSEDISFQERMRASGFKLFCDTRYEARHYHTVPL